MQVLREITTSAIQDCYGFKRSTATHYLNRKPGLLQSDRTEQAWLFEIVGADYTGPLYYKSKSEKDLKAYISLFSCSVSRDVDLNLVSNFSTGNFIKSFRRLISRRGKPNIIYSDNTKIFKAREKLLNSIKRNERFLDFFSKEKIIWKFNLSRAPW